MIQLKKILPALAVIFAFSSFAAVISDSSLTDLEVKGSELIACSICFGKGGLEPPVYS
ncbi:hypothetical protein HMF8227_01256 [Saliniradius amylolyticus]|uniref:Uncharacterized protein n=1 Tax=Saliniradius amylolyticus TaxID=2183582 RepID=A0A2S2E269_9ALTE|nr:hypothetical protein [Saliniradius amylolyticus]AWL11734.1 hypothetical protein HMF8227_01256 [Saliniradius amylolyticus]